MQREIDAFAAVLRYQGVHAALQFLNNRTPHRCTGIYRFDGDMLRNEVLYDRYYPQQRKGPDAPLSASYCALVGRQQAMLEVQDAATDPRVQDRLQSPPMLSYCGVLIRDAHGQPFGTLCHYDLQRCQTRTSEQPLLEAAAALLYGRLWPAALPGASSPA